MERLNFYPLLFSALFFSGVSWSSPQKPADPEKLSPPKTSLENFAFSYTIIEGRFPKVSLLKGDSCSPLPYEMVKNYAPSSVKRFNVVSIYRDSVLKSFVSDVDVPVVVEVEMKAPETRSHPFFLSAQDQEKFIKDFQLKTITIHREDPKSQSIVSKSVEYQDKWLPIVDMVSSSLKVWMIFQQKDQSLSVVKQDASGRPLVSFDKENSREICLAYGDKSALSGPSSIQINQHESGELVSTNLLLFMQDKNIKVYDWDGSKIIEDLIGQVPQS